MRCARRCDDAGVAGAGKEATNTRGGVLCSRRARRAAVLFEAQFHVPEVSSAAVRGANAGECHFPEFTPRAEHRVSLTVHGCFQTLVNLSMRIELEIFRLKAEATGTFALWNLYSVWLPASAGRSAGAFRLLFQ